MGYYDDYLKALGKSGTKTSGVTGSGSYATEYNKALNNLMKKKKKEEEEEEEEIAPVRIIPSSIMPSSVVPSSQDNSFSSIVRDRVFTRDATKSLVYNEVSQKDENPDLFGFDLVQKSKVFDDGYDRWDIAKTILGTAGDAALGIVKGFSRIPEGIADLAGRGIAGVADAFGADEFADRVREAADANLVDWATKDADDFLEKYTVLGRTSDAIAEGLGNVALTAATAGAGAALGLGTAGSTALSYGVTGLGTMGNAMGEAYQGGGTDTEAVVHGLISSAVEIGTEMLFGGLGKAVDMVGFSKGLGGLDDKLAQSITSKIKNQWVKNAVQAGVKGTGEGIEEWLAGGLQAISKKVTYMSERDIEDILEDENLAEQFFVGAFTGNLSQVSSVVNASKAGRDFVTGRTDNEQAVIDKVYENRIAEEEKNGKLTNKEKNKIYDRVVSDMEKGRIDTDIIESVLGGETYEGYKSLTDKETSLTKRAESLTKEINTILDKGNPTLRDSERLAAARKELGQVKSDLESLDLKTAKSNLFSEVDKLTENDSLLRESYNERTRRGQKFEADLTKYEGKQKEIVQKAIDSGILNNTNRTHEFVDLVAKVAADKGVSFDFTNNQKLKESGFAIEGKTVNGFVTKDGVTLNIQSAKSLDKVVGHEITHVLEGTELYDVLQSAVIEFAKSKNDYQGRYDTLAKLYEGIEGADINKELTADLVGDYLFTDIDFVNSLSTNHRNVFEKIYDEIKYLCKVATAGSKEAEELERVKKIFAEAYRQEATDTEIDDVQYSLSDSNGNELSPAVQKRFENSKVVDEDGNLKVVYHGTTGGEFSIFDKSKGSIEGDFGSGFYFTDSEHDVSRNYEGGGADFENKVARLAEQIYGEEDISYSEAEQKARNELYVDSHKFEVYLNIENPAIVGKTTLLDYETFAEEYDRKDYDSDEDYESDIEYAIQDKIDTIIWEVEINVDLYNTDGLAEVLWEAVNNGGIDIAQLKAKVNDLYLEDSNGNLAGNEVTRQIIESLGYDGIIDNTVSSKFNMGMESGTTHYIVFKPNQIKNVSNQNPTDNPDINLSLSENDIAPAGNFMGKDLALESALTEPTPNVAADESLEERLYKAGETLKALDDELNNVFTEDFNDTEVQKRYTELAENYKKAEAEYRQLLQEAAEMDNQKFAELTDADIPPEIEAPYQGDDHFQIPQQSVVDISREAKNEFGFTNKEAHDLRDLISDFAEGKVDKFNLGLEIQSNFKITEKTQNDQTLLDAKAFIRQTRINVPENVQRGIADYKDFKKRNRGKIRFSKDGAGIDQVYQEGQEMFGSLFPEEVINPEDQLLQIAEVANTKFRNSKTYRRSTQECNTIADWISQQVDNARRAQKEAFANKTAKESFNNLFRETVADELAPAIDKDKFFSNRATELYQEITSLKKGVRASQSLGYILDHGYDWRSVKTAMLNIKDNPNQVVNENSAAESVIREMINNEYEQAVLDLNTPNDVSEQIRQRMLRIQTEVANDEKARVQSNLDFDEDISRWQEEYEAKKNKNTKVANDILRKIERAKRLKADVDASYAQRIETLNSRLKKMSKPTYKTAMQRKAKQAEYTSLMENLVGDTSTWQDKKLGLSYKVNTLRRNLRDIVRDANGNRDIARADAIYEELQGNYNRNEASLKREFNQLLKPIAELKPTRAEYVYANMLGEFRHNPQTTLSEETVKEYYEKNKSKIDAKKVDKMIDTSRKIFDDLLPRINERLKEQGMKEIPYRKGYFPHFTSPKQSALGKKFNWKTIDNEIPTSIAGITETFNPERSWQPFNKERKSDVTDYDLAQALDSYVHGALDWIYHIEDIQKRRALENYIRYTHSEEGVKARVDAIRNSEEYDADEMQEQIDLVYAEARNPLNNFVTDLRAGTNTLANKKSSMDRALEEKTNRKVYSVMTNLNNRINANMVVGSLSSALTNFIPITQSWVEVSPVYTLRGMGDTIRSTIRSDGTIEKSTFLTNRLVEEEKLYKTGWDKASDKAAFMMNAIDNFASQTVWRSKYLQNIAEGMSENEAIRNADQFAENVIAGRSRGNMPTLFDAKNPLTKMFTAFQLEVNNQYGYMFKDAPQDTKNKARLIKGYATAFLGAYLYNAAYSSLTGRDAALDPIGIFEDLFKGFFGSDDEEEEPFDALLGFGENVIQELPFVGGLLGGGRIPLSSALPYSGEYEGISKFAQDIADENWESVGEEMLQPLYYLALPFGGGQIRKTNQGLAMFSDDLPISGSYTKKKRGNLRFPVEETVGNVIQAVLFGQYANKNARDYFDNERSPLKEKQIQEFIDVDIPISDYWEYREGLSKQETLEDKFDYISALDLPVAKKNILINNIVDRKEDVDMENYEDFDSLEEFDFANKYPEKYSFFEESGIGYKAYANAEDYGKDAYNWAYKNPEKYTFLEESGIGFDTYVNADKEDREAYRWACENPAKYTMSKAISNDFLEFYRYKGEISEIQKNNDSSSGTKDKDLVVDYIFSLDIDYGQKAILFRSLYDSKKDKNAYNQDIVNYLESREDISWEDEKTILEELGFTVEDDGTIYWD